MVKQDDLYQEAVTAFGAALSRLARGYEANPDQRRDLLQDIHMALWQRASLTREHAFLARLWLWFLLPVGVAELALLAGMWATGGPGAAIVLPLVTGIVALFAFMFMFVRSRQQARRLRTGIDALGNGRE